MGVAIGIDIGDNRSSVSWYDPDERLARHIPLRGAGGSESLPTAVYFPGDNRSPVAGHAAVNIRGLFPDKVLIGLPAVLVSQSALAHTADGPSAIAALTALIGTLKEEAERYLDETVDSAVVSTPARLYRKLPITEAGQRAGLEILGVVPHPCAAVLASRHLDHDECAAANYLVCDLSELSIECSIVSMRGAAGQNGETKLPVLIVNHTAIVDQSERMDTSLPNEVRLLIREVSAKFLNIEAYRANVSMRVAPLMSGMTVDMPRLAQVLEEETGTPHLRRCSRPDKLAVAGAAYFANIWPTIKDATPSWALADGTRDSHMDKEAASPSSSQFIETEKHRAADSAANSVLHEDRSQNQAENLSNEANDHCQTLHLQASSGSGLIDRLMRCLANCLQRLARLGSRRDGGEK